NKMISSKRKLTMVMAHQEPAISVTDSLVLLKNIFGILMIGLFQLRLIKDSKGLLFGWRISVR
ncbi:MAG: hypothetical protein QF535_21175, partial [Anaerolineales bacterium]|nr:hypothetical protein [Anaerolineales bacterium]